MDARMTNGGAPAHWACDTVLLDGGTIHIRPIEPADGPALVAFFEGLSAKTVYLRFFSYLKKLSDEMVTHLTTVDHHDRVALVAELAGRLIGVGRYERNPGSDSAEVAFVVADEHQGRGIGTVLLEHLAAAARECGLTRFVADVLPHNAPMLDVFRNAGFDERAGFSDGVTQVELLIEPTDRSRAAAETREHRAEAASVSRLLHPRSVAVVGASRNPATVGHQVLRSLLAGGFDGPVHPVNPAATSVASVQAHPTVLDIPGPVDLAVVAVPSTAVVQVVTQCAEKGVKDLVVLSAGFGEVGPAGRASQDEVRRLARANGMRLVGPNCIGVANTAIGLNATFSPFAPRPGRIAMQSQSGALGIAILEHSARIGLGVSSFVSVGNKADVSGNDLLQYWEDDPATGVVLFRQAGVIRVDTLDELFDMALLLDAQPLPGGRRVAIVGNSGGPGILATDACDGAGLDVPLLGEATQAALRQVVDPNASVANPVDLVAAATPAVYEAALRIVLGDDAVDAVICICTPTFAAPPPAVARVLTQVASTTHKPIVGCLLAWPEGTPLLAGGAEGRDVPAFSSPEPAARALARAAAYAEWKRRPPGALPELTDFDLDAARAVVASALADEPTGAWLSPADVEVVLSAIGVPVVRSLVVASSQEARVAAAAMGGPVALKADGPGILHKSDVGGVRLGLRTADEVADAYEEMAGRLGPSMTGGVVQQMAAPGVETIVGVVQDPLFGPLVMFGLGGVSTELLGDRSFRVLPLTDADAAEQVRGLRSSPLLFGYRGAPHVAVAAVEDVLQRVARLAGSVAEVSELDVNPLIASADGATAVDARIHVRPAPHSVEQVRRMS
jgi:acyl-CoA synthetase (NDP forming)/GNAT superfamily N-acetyltransferase